MAFFKTVTFLKKGRLKQNVSAFLKNTETLHKKEALAS